VTRCHCWAGFNPPWSTEIDPTEAQFIAVKEVSPSLSFSAGELLWVRACMRAYGAHVKGSKKILMAEFVNALLGLMVRLVLFLAGLSLILLLAWMLQRRLRGTTLWGAQGAARYSNGQQRSEQPSMTFTGKFLHAFMNSERIKSHLPMELTRGKDRFQLTAWNLTTSAVSCCSRVGCVACCCLA